MKRTVALIGVPSSAGAHWPGQEKAPQYLRNAGLAARLEAVALDVIDCGDLPVVRFRPDRAHRRQQNLAAVVAVAQGVADQVDAALRRNALPLVLGGDCTIGLGVLSGFMRHEPNLGLLYFDGHVDLNTPATSRSGILDSMGVAHMIAEPGTAEALCRIGATYPLLHEDRIVLFGYNPLELNAPEKDVLARRTFKRYPLPEVEGRAVEMAREAVAYMEGCARRFVVHFDVDVIDFTEMPLADVPQFSRGMLFREAMACLSVFAASPHFGGLTLTEINPDHTDEEGTVVEAFVEGVARALGCGPDAQM